VVTLSRTWTDYDDELDVSWSLTSWAVLFWVLGVGLWVMRPPMNPGWWVLLGSLSMFVGTVFIGRAIVERIDS
jgi:hypothetical protein